MNMKTLALLLSLALVVAASAQQGRKPSPSGYSIAQASSDKAQLHTFAFSGLAFLTGDFGAATFIPPGKVCDYFGFQYMRDIDSAQKGHNPAFLNRVAGNMILILSDTQKKDFLALAEDQAPKLEALARRRLPVIKAFYLQLQPDAKTLQKSPVISAIADIFEEDAKLSLQRAEVMGKVARSLSDEQKASLAKLKFGDFSTWPDADPRESNRQMTRGKAPLVGVAYMTYLSEFFSWYAGSIEADTYFCPERHGTYFGGFYMKDMPAMGKRDFDISLTVTGDSGKGFLDLLTPDQREKLEKIVPEQRSSIQEIVRTRRSISTELRKYLTGESPAKDQVLKLGRRYGELDGAMTYAYARAFAEVNKTLTVEQRAAMVKLRNLNGYQSAPYYIYSRAESKPLEMDTTKFFEAAK